ncbi:GNAT family N-acetyltransferase [Bacillus dakarensis]|uniref:GNAT family N-acetyltransferase n=1 Tax=Robertmurraya dakarensis TaxID=1926278 RepID=UPI00098158B5|nr:GNAT family N-acetyltransferase [Bacillus dakarensis]
MLKIRNVLYEDLPKLIEIETQCFTKEEAATQAAFEKRIKLIPDSFFVAEEDGVIVGLVNGPVIESPYITDDLFSEIKPNPPEEGYQSILGIAVTPKFQKKGVAAALLKELEREAQECNREGITLTCKEELISFYEKFGFMNRGISNSEHGGVTWYNMIKKLN